MISTVLANLGPWSDLLLVLAVVAVLVAGRVLARRGARGRRTAGLLALLCTAAALALMLAPESGAIERQAFCATAWEGNPFSDTANTVLLLPTAYLGAIAVRAPLPVLAATAGLSALVEAVQGAATLLHRSCDTGDWVTNTAGALAGALAAAVVLRITGGAHARADGGRRERVRA